MTSVYREDNQARTVTGVVILRRNDRGELEPADSSISGKKFSPKTKALLLPVANDEYEYPITGISKVEISCRTLQDIRYGYSPGITQTDDYRTIRAGQEKSLDFGTNAYLGSLYFACSSDDAILEIETWSFVDAD